VSWPPPGRAPSDRRLEAEVRIAAEDDLRDEPWEVSGEHLRAVLRALDAERARDRRAAPDPVSSRIVAAGVAASMTLLACAALLRVLG
jgi:hypothetical protein